MTSPWKNTKTKPPEKGWYLVAQEDKPRLLWWDGAIWRNSEGGQPDDYLERWMPIPEVE